MSTQLRIGIALGLVTAALVGASVWLVREVSIDKCLDRGGAWDYEQMHCVVALKSKNFGADESDQSAHREPEASGPSVSA
ncbi:hypothetical protein AAFF27_19410 [Xylophilus sp. GW821-FHT01B05]